MILISSTGTTVINNDMPDPLILFLSHEPKFNFILLITLREFREHDKSSLITIESKYVVEILKNITTIDSV